jgi:glycosyltransferase involved in cell wall biosynthesis
VWGTNYVYELSEKFAARKCHKILSVADAMTQQFLARGIGKPSQYETVWSGMEVGRYMPGPDHAMVRAEVREELGIGPDEVVVGTVARLSPQKGHDDLIDALGQTLATRKDIRLLWVGDGWLRDRLYARLDALGIRQKVVTTGLVPSEKVPRFISAMDVLAHPSSREGLPRTVPQALLGGVCPVAYDVDGTREACIDGKTGLLVRHGDIAGLRQAVLRVVDDADLRRKLAIAGQEMCKHRFDAKVMVDRLEEVYRQARA